MWTAPGFNPCWEPVCQTSATFGTIVIAFPVSALSNEFVAYKIDL